MAAPSILTGRRHGKQVISGQPKLPSLPGGNFLVADDPAAEYTAPERERRVAGPRGQGEPVRDFYRRIFMRIAALLMLGLGLVIAFLGSATAQEQAGKEMTLKGTITCAKCDLKLQDKCATVIQIKKGDTDVVYYFDKASNKKYHGDICKEAKKGEVTGRVTKQGDKRMVAVESLKYE
jgi:hypothetical protein